MFAVRAACRRRVIVSAPPVNVKTRFGGAEVVGDRLQAGVADLARCPSTATLPALALMKRVRHAGKVPPVSVRLSLVVCVPPS